MREGARAVMIGLALGALVSASAQGLNWETRLSTVPIDPTTAATVTGQGRAAAALEGAKLTITGSFEGLKGPATTAELRQGADTGVRGEPIASLSVSPAVAGSISAAVELTPAQVEALRAGRLYIQIQSQSAPDGNLWGWLLRDE